MALSLLVTRICVVLTTVMTICTTIHLEGLMMSLFGLTTRGGGVLHLKEGSNQCQKQVYMKYCLAWLPRGCWGGGGEGGGGVISSTKR